MIKIVLKPKDITITGHANYDTYGKDIVCAAVSATVICTVNAISSININAINVLNDTDKLVINILDNDDITNKLLNNMISLLKELAIKYPKNIKIIDEEE